MATVTQEVSAASWTPPNLWASLRALISGGIPTLLTTDGVIAPFVSATNFITKVGSANLTLAAPIATVNDGNRIEIISTTPFAHVISAIGLLQTGTSAVNYITFGAFPGASVVLKAYQGKWIVLGSNAVSFQ